MPSYLTPKHKDILYVSQLFSPSAPAPTPSQYQNNNLMAEVISSEKSVRDDMFENSLCRNIQPM